MTATLQRKPSVHPRASEHHQSESKIIRTLNAEKLSAISYNQRIFDPRQASFGRHGIFNPSCVWDGKKATIIARAEHSEATWHGRFIIDKATPCLSEMRITPTGQVVFDSMHVPISTGMPSPCRPEDWRLFHYKGDIWTNYTTYFFYNDGWPQKDVMSRTCLGKLDGNNIRFIKEMQINDTMNSEEKNWVFFEHQGKMKFIYSIEPWRIFTCDDNGNVQEELRIETKIPRRANKFLANSTNPVLVETESFGECYLLIYHYFLDPLAEMGGTRNRTYFQFMLFFDKDTLKPLAHTYRPFLGGGMGITQGRHDNVIYCSGAFQRGDAIYVVAGEGDTYSQLYVVPLDKIEPNLKKL